MLIFLGIFILVIAIWGTYLGFRLVKPLALSPSWTKVLWALLYLPLLVPPIFFLRRNLDNEALSQFLEVTVLTSLAFYSFLLGLALLRDTTGMLLYSLSKILKKPDLALFSSDQILKSSCLTIIGASVLMIGLGLFNALSIPGIKEVEVPVTGLHPDLDGFRIVQLTDLHVDELKRKRYFEEITRAVTGINPDITVITGDLADGSIETCSPRTEPLRGLPEETYFITGNHDYYAGYENWIKHTASLGFRILLDEYTVIERGSARILLAGVTDPAATGLFPDRPRGVEVAVQGAPATDFRILLAHQPKEIYDAEKFGFDLQLSGHTHGGQFFPWNYVIGFFHPYVKGLNRHGNMWIYVSQGTGFWGPPIRLGTSSEITLLTLRRIHSN
ncbi:MAG: metallophosphoesterase [Acidobacteriota bacterium]